MAVYPIHSKGAGAKTCPNCKSHKNFYLELADNLVELHEELFCIFARFFCVETHAAIVNRARRDIYVPKVTDILRLCASKNIFTDLKIIEGSR